MKGQQLITLSAEAVIEAVTEYLQKRSVETITVTKAVNADGVHVQAGGRPWIVEDAKLAVTFTSEPKTPPVTLRLESEEFKKGIEGIREAVGVPSSGLVR